MPIAEKEFVLNYTMNRWQLNFKRNVGPTSASIRDCEPATIGEWEDYYYTNIRSRGHINSLGNKLYQHITETLPGEKSYCPKIQLD